MNCDIKFDFVSQHNGEYWFSCTTCGASDWVGRGDTVTSMKDCLKDVIEKLSDNEKVLIHRAYFNGYKQAKQDMLEAVSGPNTFNLKHIIKL